MRTVDLAFHARGGAGLVPKERPRMKQLSLRIGVSIGAGAILSSLAPAVAARTDARAADVKAVEAVLGQYQSAVERLDPSGTETLFAPDSEIFESGGSEGTYANYLAHHLRPELAEFKSFRFSDYRITVRFEGGLALASETYRYRIEPKQGDVAERLGVATSVLRKQAGHWKIISMHNSARRPRAP